MKRSDLQGLEGLLMKEVVKRRGLGGYSPDADGILLIAETVMRLLQHTIDNTLSDEEMEDFKQSVAPKKQAKKHGRVS